MKPFSVATYLNFFRGLLYDAPAVCAMFATCLLDYCAQVILGTGFVSVRRLAELLYEKSIDDLQAFSDFVVVLVKRWVNQVYGIRAQSQTQEF
jgi:hypothetical protein